MTGKRSSTPGVECMYSEDGAWYELNLKKSHVEDDEEIGPYLKVVYTDGVEEHIAPEHLETRVRLASKQVQDKQCRRLKEGRRVVASLKRKEEGTLQYYDAIVTQVERREHGQEDNSCTCKVHLRWCPPPDGVVTPEGARCVPAGDEVRRGIGTICFINPDTREHPILNEWREQLAKLAQKHAQKPGVNNPPSRAHAAVPSPDASRQTTPVSSSAKRARSPDSCRANGDASASQLTPSQADDVVDALASLKNAHHLQGAGKGARLHQAARDSVEDDGSFSTQGAAEVLGHMRETLRPLHPPRNPGRPPTPWRSSKLAKGAPASRDKSAEAPSPQPEGDKRRHQVEYGAGRRSESPAPSDQPRLKRLRRGASRSPQLQEPLTVAAPVEVSQEEPAAVHDSPPSPAAALPANAAAPADAIATVAVSPRVADKAGNDDDENSVHTTQPRASLTPPPSPRHTSQPDTLPDRGHGGHKATAAASRQQVGEDVVMADQETAPQAAGEVGAEAPPSLPPPPQQLSPLLPAEVSPPPPPAPVSQTEAAPARHDEQVVQVAPQGDTSLGRGVLSSAEADEYHPATAAAPDASAPDAGGSNEHHHVSATADAHTTPACTAVNDTSQQGAAGEDEEGAGEGAYEEPLPTQVLGIPEEPAPEEEKPETSAAVDEHQLSPPAGRTGLISAPGFTHPPVQPAAEPDAGAEEEGEGAGATQLPPVPSTPVPRDAGGPLEAADEQDGSAEPAAEMMDVEQPQEQEQLFQDSRFEQPMQGHQPMQGQQAPAELVQEPMQGVDPADNQQPPGPAAGGEAGGAGMSAPAPAPATGSKDVIEIDLTDSDLEQDIGRVPHAVPQQVVLQQQQQVQQPPLPFPFPTTGLATAGSAGLQGLGRGPPGIFSAATATGLAGGDLQPVEDARGPPHLQSRPHMQGSYPAAAVQAATAGPGAHPQPGPGHEAGGVGGALARGPSADQHPAAELNVDDPMHRTLLHILARMDAMEEGFNGRMNQVERVVKVMVPAMRSIMAPDQLRRAHDSQRLSPTPSHPPVPQLSGAARVSDGGGVDRHSPAMRSPAIQPQGGIAAAGGSFHSAATDRQQGAPARGGTSDVLAAARQAVAAATALAGGGGTAAAGPSDSGRQSDPGRQGQSAQGMGKSFKEVVQYTAQVNHAVNRKRYQSQLQQLGRPPTPQEVLDNPPFIQMPFVLCTLPDLLSIARLVASGQLKLSPYMCTSLIDNILGSGILTDYQGAAYNIVAEVVSSLGGANLPATTDVNKSIQVSSLNSLLRDMANRCEAVLGVAGPSVGASTGAQIVAPTMGMAAAAAGTSTQAQQPGAQAHPFAPSVVQQQQQQQVPASAASMSQAAAYMQQQLLAMQWQQQQQQQLQWQQLHQMQQQQLHQHNSTGAQPSAQQQQQHPTQQQQQQHPTQQQYSTQQQHQAQQQNVVPQAQAPGAGHTNAQGGPHHQSMASLQQQLLQQHQQLHQMRQQHQEQVGSGRMMHAQQQAQGHPAQQVTTSAQQAQQGHGYPTTAVTQAARADRPVASEAQQLAARPPRQVTTGGLPTTSERQQQAAQHPRPPVVTAPNIQQAAPQPQQQVVRQQQAVHQRQAQVPIAAVNMPQHAAQPQPQYQQQQQQQQRVAHVSAAHGNAQAGVATAPQPVVAPQQQHQAQQRTPHVHVTHANAQAGSAGTLHPARPQQQQQQHRPQQANPQVPAQAGVPNPAQPHPFAQQQQQHPRVPQPPPAPAPAPAQPAAAAAPREGSHHHAQAATHSGAQAATHSGAQLTTQGSGGISSERSRGTSSSRQQPPLKRPLSEMERSAARGALAHAMSFRTHARTSSLDAAAVAIAAATEAASQGQSAAQQPAHAAGAGTGSQQQQQQQGLQRGVSHERPAVGAPPPALQKTRFHPTPQPQHPTPATAAPPAQTAAGAHARAPAEGALAAARAAAERPRSAGGSDSSAPRQQPQRRHTLNDLLEAMVGMEEGGGGDINPGGGSGQVTGGALPTAVETAGAGHMGHAGGAGYGQQGGEPQPAAPPSVPLPFPVLTRRP